MPHRKQPWPHLKVLHEVVLVVQDLQQILAGLLICALHHILMHNIKNYVKKKKDPESCTHYFFAKSPVILAFETRQSEDHTGPTRTITKLQYLCTFRAEPVISSNEL